MPGAIDTRLRRLGRFGCANIEKMPFVKSRQRPEHEIGLAGRIEALARLAHHQIESVG